MLSYNADKLIETVRMHQSISSMKAQLEHFQETSEYLPQMSSSICSLQNLIEELEQKINKVSP